MREKTFHVYVDSHDRSLLLQSLVELKNLLIQQGRYTDCVDELIFKVINAPVKKLKISCCLLYTSPSPRDRTRSRMPSSA